MVAMGSGVGREVSSVFQAWEEFVVWEREDYLTLQVHSSGASINQTSSLIVGLGVGLEKLSLKFSSYTLRQSVQKFHNNLRKEK